MSQQCSSLSHTSGDYPVSMKFIWKRYFLIFFFQIRKVSLNESFCLFVTGYNQFILSMNRAIPICISVYRYCCVFHDATLRDEPRKKKIQHQLLIFIIISSLVNSSTVLMCPNSFQRYLECVGREEAFKYNLVDFYSHKPSGPLTNMKLFSVSRFDTH